MYLTCIKLERGAKGDGVTSVPDIYQVGERGQRVTVSWVYLTCIKLERGAKGNCVTSVPDIHQVGERGQRVTV